VSGTIPIKEQRISCTRSGNRCALPDCRKILVEGKTEYDSAELLGFMAHIVGEKPGSARYDAEMPLKEKNSYENLIMVCGSCHKKIDGQPNTYTVEKLHEIKDHHEKWYLDLTKEQIINITFSELDVVTKFLSSDQIPLDESYLLIPPKEKIQKNTLSSSSERLIIMGLTQVKQVEKFIDESPDINFGDRLTSGFVSEYEKLKLDGLKGDDLFAALLEFAQGSSNDLKLKAAGLSVLVYLFEKCEIFEK